MAYINADRIGKFLLAASYVGGELNYNGYCNPEVDKLIDRQSAEADRERRKQLVWEIERKLAEDGARPIFFYDRRATCWQPWVKGLTIISRPHGRTLHGRDPDIGGDRCPVAMPRDGADHHDLRGVCHDDLRTPRAFSRPLASRARSLAPSSALGSQRTLRWSKPDSNL
jgi:hypothetical protein